LISLSDSGDELVDKPEGQENLHQHETGMEVPRKVEGDVMILDMAMRKEEYSIRLYKALFDFVEREDAKAILKHLIEEETDHYRLLNEVMSTGRYEKIGMPSDEKSLELTDYLIKEEIRKSSGPKEVIKLAIRREEESEEFYLSRIHYIQDEKLKELYESLAKEEGNHRQKLLNDYDNLVIMKIT
jgi:rubrerythrin